MDFKMSEVSNHRKVQHQGKSSRVALLLDAGIMRAMFTVLTDSQDSTAILTPYITARTYVLPCSLRRAIRRASSSAATVSAWLGSCSAGGAPAGGCRGAAAAADARCRRAAADCSACSACTVSGGYASECCRSHQIYWSMNILHETCHSGRPYSHRRLGTRNSSKV